MPLDPELPDTVEPFDAAEPVAPELTAPEEALVALPLNPSAEPLLPPAVVPLALLLPLSPPLADEPAVVEAGPESPLTAVP